jgi:hypothetical protein
MHGWLLTTTELQSVMPQTIATSEVAKAVDAYARSLNRSRQSQISMSVLERVSKNARVVL